MYETRIDEKTSAEVAEVKYQTLFLCCVSGLLLVSYFFVILPFLILLEKSNNCDFTRRPITKYYNVDYRQLDVVQLSKVCVN